VFSSEWVSAVEFRQQLGICRTTQWNLMQQGILKPCVHYFRVSTGRRAALRFNLPACELALQIMTQS
jgi:hypothetical protein